MSYEKPFDPGKSNGSLFENDRKQNEASPDLKGFLRIGVDLLQKIADAHRDGEAYVEVDLGGWYRRAASGTDYLWIEGGLRMKADAPSGMRRIGQATAQPVEEKPAAESPRVLQRAIPERTTPASATKLPPPVRRPPPFVGGQRKPSAAPANDVLDDEIPY